MFDMIQIGKKISELRKTNNMTQMELADQLGISFQAVSNWERGNTMPDISKLPELSAIFHVSMDELLNGEAPIISSTIEGTMDDISMDVLTEENVADALPLLKPRQAEALLEKADVSSFKNIYGFLPFLPEDEVVNLANQAIEKGENIQGFLPFLPQDMVVKLTNQAIEKGKNIQGFLPFLPQDMVIELTKQAIEKIKNIQGFLPFLPQDMVVELANQAIEKGKNIQGFLPFLPQDMVTTLAYQAFEKREHIEGFLPFLPEEVVTDLAIKSLKRG